MLDAIAGYTVKRIRAKHEVAIRHPADIADLLHAYAHLNHMSVVSHMGHMTDKFVGMRERDKGKPG